MYTNSIKNVVSQIINMLSNNIINNNGFEHFDGWCENGEVFDYNVNDVNIMYQLAPYVDALTEKCVELTHNTH